MTVLHAYAMIIGQTHRRLLQFELLQFFSTHLSASQRRLVSLFSQNFCQYASAVENCSFFTSMCIQGKLFSLFSPKICPCASHEESCSSFVQHLLVCIIAEAVAVFYTKTGNVHHDCTCKATLNMCRISVTERT